LSTTIPSALQTHYAGETTTLANLLRIQRTDGTVFGFTSASESVTISGTFYSASEGMLVSSMASSSGLNVDNGELSTIDDGTIFTRAQILGGVWQTARYLFGRYNWANPSDGVEFLTAGTVGRISLREGMATVELRGLQQYLQQSVGNVTTRTCRARFADYPTSNGNNLCRLASASFIEARAVATLVDGRTFTSTGTTKPDDYYGDGLLTWTSGPNVGISQKVSAFLSASSRFSLLFEPPSAIAASDGFSVIAGCRKRLLEDCKTKHNNVLNFQGEPHLPGIDKLTAAADVSV
jgi:uncharacterized phage protein (TIGR02218 family)